MNPFDASLENLRNKFVLGAQNRLRRIRNTLRRLEDNPSDEAALNESMRHFHALAGAAGTYGFPEVSETAAALEQECHEHINARSIPKIRQVENWRNEVRRLRREFGMASSGIVLRREETEKKESVRDVLLLQSFSRNRDLLSKVLSAENMKVRVASDRATARRGIRDALPDAMIVDLAVQGGTGVKVVEYLRSLAEGAGVAVVLINSEDFPIDKVEAVRCGADALIEAGALPEKVTDRLRALLARDEGRHNNILYIEPDPDQVAFVQRLLGAAGHKVKVCLDPSEVEVALSNEMPDLVLMEVVLPGVNGFDLARMLGEDPRYAHIPVVFMTTRDHVPSHMDAQGAAGHEFLLKPVEPRVLLGTITAHLERVRLQATASERDGVTGLYNHSTFVRRLESWMRTGETHRRPSCLALIDVVGIRDINLKFGHHVGDQVLRELAEVVRGEVRSSHLVARYGSDQFILMLYDLEENDCLRLLGGLRNEFSENARFTPEGRTFKSDFRAGISRLNPTWRRPQIWLAEVESALLEAKSINGRRFAIAERAGRGHIESALAD